MYLLEEDAEDALDADPEMKQYRHVVELVAMTVDEYNSMEYKNDDSI